METGGSETKRLIIVERASRVNVTSRNNLGREHVNAKSGVRIVRRGENGGNRRRCDAISKQKSGKDHLDPRNVRFNVILRKTIRLR